MSGKNVPDFLTPKEMDDIFNYLMSFENMNRCQVWSIITFRVLPALREREKAERQAQQNANKAWRELLRNDAEGKKTC